MEIGELLIHVMGGLFILLGGGLTVWQCLAIASAVESRKWPRAPGKILRSFLDRSQGSEGLVYLRRVTCQYRIGDSEYICSRIRFGISLWHSSQPGYSLRSSKQYWVGSDVEVFFNPEDPQDSVLEPGLALSLLEGLAFSLMVFGTGIFVGFVSK